MGITKPSLYACFGNKESLFRKALDLYERDKLAYARNAMNAPTAKGVAEQMLRGALSLQIGTNDPRACLGVMSAVACTTFDDRSATKSWRGGLRPITSFSNGFAVPKRKAIFPLV
jgi:AcrR family transcriptional regulator